MSNYEVSSEAVNKTPPSDAQICLPFTATDRNLKRLLLLFLGLIAVWLVVLGVFNVRHVSDWAMGDWLINYAGGFVRRGLPGEVARLLQQHLHIPALVAILVLQWTMYAIILLGVWRALRNLRWSWWSAATVFSPATLAFVLLDPPYAFRKEILFFALLTLTIQFFRKRTGQRATVSESRKLSIWLAAGCGLCMFAHEGLLMYMPYLFAALYLGFRDLRRAALTFVAPLLVSVAAFGVLTRFPGNLNVAQRICGSVGGVLTEPPSGVCGGAIDYLARNSTYAHAQVVRVMVAGGHPVRILWMFLLPMMPAVLGLFALRKLAGREVMVLSICSAISWLLSASLFYYGTDWPRWVYIHAFCLLLVMTFLENQRQAEEPTIPQPLVRADGRPRWAALAALVLFCLGWELTEYTPRPLYGSFVRFVTHNLARGRQ